MTREIMSALAPVFFVIAVGFICGKTGLIDNTDVRSLNTVVTAVAVPLLLFATLAGSGRADVVNHLQVAIISGVVMGCVYAAVLLLEHYAFGVAAPQAAIMALTVAFPNAAAVAIPLADSVLGPTGRLAVSVVLAAGALTVSPVTLVVLERTRRLANGSAGLRARQSHLVLASVLTAYRKPLVVGPLLGLVWSLCGIPLPSVADASLLQIGDVTGGLGLFVTGLVLSGQPLALTWNVVLSTVAGGVLRPSLGVAAIWLVGVRGDLAVEIFLILAVPAGFFGILLGLGYGVVARRAGATLLYSTVLSFVTLPITIALLRTVAR